MKLFSLTPSGSLTIEPEVFTVKAFRDLQQKYPDSYLFWFIFLYHFCDFRSPIFEIKELPSRFKRAMKEAFGDNYEVMEVDETVEHCIQAYEEFSQTAPVKSLIKARKTVNDLTEFFSKINIETMEIKDASSLSLAISRMPKILAELDSTEKKIRKEMGNQRFRGGVEKGDFEDYDKTK